MLKSIFFILISLTLYAETINGVAILVKEEPITLYDIRTEMRKSGASQAETVDMLIRKKLESIEIEERGISVSDPEVHDDMEKMAEQNNMSVMQFFDAMQSTRGVSSTELKEKIKEKLLNQKLYNAIAFSHMEQPTPDEEAEYYQLHKAEFSHPESFDVIVYRSASREKLQEKVDNPMFYSPEVTSDTVTLEYSAIDPRLADLLNTTKVNSFTRVLPEGESFIGFFVREKKNIITQPLDSVRVIVANAIMGEKRKQVLNDYFARLMLNADIKTIRLPE